jgi:branched-chain amino acid aminotransferase
MSLPEYAFFKGQIVRYSEAKVGLLTHTLNYGTGAFGGIRGYWNEQRQELFVFRLGDHVRRLLQSAKLLCMEPAISEQSLAHSIVELLQAENYRRDCYIRPLAYFSDEALGCHLIDAHPDISIVAVPIDTPRLKPEGVHVTISGWRRVDDNMIPARGKIAGAYVNSFLAKTDAVRAGFDDAVLLNANGHVAEGSTTNLFVIRNGIAFTPPITDNILEGITRRTMFTLLRDELKIQVEERSIDRTEISLCEEAFLCGTATEIAAVTRVDYRTIGSGKAGPVSSGLWELFQDVIRGRATKYLEWCAPVYKPPR